MESATMDPAAADHPGEAADEQAEIIPHVEVEGSGQQLTLDCGGVPVNAATVKLIGGSIRVPVGQYDKGEIVNLAVRVRCDEVHFVDKHDPKTGEVVEVERRHLLRPVWVERVNE
jgi:hypothetical protein